MSSSLYARVKFPAVCDVSDALRAKWDGKLVVRYGKHWYSLAGADNVGLALVCPENCVVTELTADELAVAEALDATKSNRDHYTEDLGVLDQIRAEMTV